MSMLETAFSRQARPQQRRSNPMLQKKSPVSFASLRLCVRVLFCLIAMFIVVSPLHAQTPQPADQMYTIAKKLNCPTCAGRNLADCPTDTCTQWKNEIIDQLKQGKTAEEIVGYFEGRFGSTVLQEPPKAGFTLFMWLIPVMALIGFGVLVTLVIQRSSRTPATPTNTAAPANDPYAAELERQVKEGA